MRYSYPVGNESLPVRGRGLKLVLLANDGRELRSLPVRGRGLKLSPGKKKRTYSESLPVRGRGLKLAIIAKAGQEPCRSPCGGVD